MSVTGPAEVGPADWDRADWQVLRQELAAIARLAGESLAKSAQHSNAAPTDLALAKARPWRRLARTGVYDSHQVTDDRSDNRAAF
jgi:hypothetical protein